MTSLDALDLTLALSQEPAVATEPPEWRGLNRDEVKLMVTDKHGHTPVHTQFRRLADHLSAGDLVVVNTSGTVAASVDARWQGVPLRVHIAGRLPDGHWLIERRSADGDPDEAAFEPGDSVDIVDKSGHPQASLSIIAHYHMQSRLWTVVSSENLDAVTKQFGQPIRYRYISGRPALSLYQTTFARDFHSAEMPSAGRPFTATVLRQLGGRGIRLASLTLHTGVSSHEVAGLLSHHPVIPEWYRIPAATAALVKQTRQRGGRVIAVGTTVVRALEGVVATVGEVVPGSGWTAHLVSPINPPRVVGGLITGLHATQTSHLALLYAFMAPTQIRTAYEEAVSKGYLWHEFGDSHLIL